MKDEILWERNREELEEKRVPKKPEYYTHHLEGLGENSFFYCNRKEKLLDLKQKLDEKYIICIRSPTGTGKSSLIHLIKRSKEFQEKYNIFSFNNMDNPQKSLQKLKQNMMILLML